MQALLSYLTHPDNGRCPYGGSLLASVSDSLVGIVRSRRSNHEGGGRQRWTAPTLPTAPRGHCSTMVRYQETSPERVCGRRLSNDSHDSLRDGLWWRVSRLRCERGHVHHEKRVPREEWSGVDDLPVTERPVLDATTRPRIPSPTVPRASRESLTGRGSGPALHVPGMLTADELADVLGISAVQASKRVRQLNIPRQRVQGAYRIDQDGWAILARLYPRCQAAMTREAVAP